MGLGKLLDDRVEVVLRWYIRSGFSDSVASLLWRYHKDASYFLSRGGTKVPPPGFCNLSLTNKCNLRCEICGSQKTLDETGVLRRHMELSTFRAVAETIFPFIVEVELNSQGDPLLHPQIEIILDTIADYHCDIKVQTNGTLFTDRVIEIFMRQRGQVMLSLDAVGSRFDEVRQGGEWAKAEPQVVKFLRRRDPSRLRVGVYPTLTRRTVSEVISVVQWAADHGVEEVAFHRYSPIRNSLEEEPLLEEMEGAKQELQEWLRGKENVINITIDGKRLNPGHVPEKVTAHWSLKRMLAISQHQMMFPRETGMYRADPLRICVAPNYYAEIGLDGQISTCCRAQDVVLGYATSVAEFADAWFGDNYRKIRKSLQRDASGPFPLSNCEECVKLYAPHTYTARRTGIQEDSALGDADALSWPERDWIRLDVIQKEIGNCHIAVLPSDIGDGHYQLWEDEACLGPKESLHDDIRQYGNGAYSIWGRHLYFSTSDNTDARRNGRLYTLRKTRSDLIMVDAQPREGSTSASL
jgi:MoaA/NifB/PqqE/SkfB family radical SAM enzyme